MVVGGVSVQDATNDCMLAASPSSHGLARVYEDTPTSLHTLGVREGQNSIQSFAAPQIFLG